MKHLVDYIGKVVLRSPHSRSSENTDSGRTHIKDVKRIPLKILCIFEFIKIYFKLNRFSRLKVIIINVIGKIIML